jgi:hypothetical protein
VPRPIIDALRHIPPGTPPIFLAHGDADIVSAKALGHPGHAVGRAVVCEALEPPAQKELVARALGFVLEADAVGMEKEVLALVPELHQEVGVAVRAAVGRGLEAPGEADPRFARGQHAVERIARG